MSGVMQQPQQQPQFRQPEELKPLLGQPPQQPGQQPMQQPPRPMGPPGAGPPGVGAPQQNGFQRPLGPPQLGPPGAAPRPVGVAQQPGARPLGPPGPGAGPPGPSGPPRPMGPPSGPPVSAVGGMPPQPQQQQPPAAGGPFPPPTSQPPGVVPAAAYQRPPGPQLGAPQPVQSQPGPAAGFPPRPGPPGPPGPGGMPPPVSSAPTAQQNGFQRPPGPPQPGPGPSGAYPRPAGGAPPPMSQPGGLPPRPGPPGPPAPGMSMPPQPGAAPGPYPPAPGMPPQPQQPGAYPQPPRPGFPPGPGGPPPPQQPGGYPPQPGFPQQQQQPQPGGYPGAAPGLQSPRRSLDPDQMPSPIHVMEEDQQNHGGYFDTRDKGATPPLVTTKFTVRDYGNASPRFIRSTLYNVPATPDMLKQTAVPFGLVVSPFASVGEGEIEPPVSDFGPTGPVRCVRCKAYMCPFMQFIDGGRRFQCPFCKATSDVPQEYFQHLDHNGMRLDHYQRPELCLGAYEVLATKDYCRDSTEPTAPGVIFAIDVSYPMMKEGVVQIICQNMKKLLKHLPKDMNCDKDKMKVGFMTYDSKVHFYNLNPGLSQPQQLSVGDVGDMFVPLVNGLLVDADEAEVVIDALMEQIPNMFGPTRETETVLGPVVQAGKEAFKAAGCAGKLIVFHHNLPVADAPGRLKNRDDRKVLGTEKEKTVLVPQTKFYNELGQECVGVGCSVDLFLFNNAYIDVATLSQVCRLTGGQVYKYTYFQPEVDGERFLRDLEHDLRRPVVFDAIMRVRTSTGVRPVDFYGSFYMANTTDTELASMNADSAVACEVKHDDKLTEEDGVYIQVAVLFTSCAGQRRLRILNLALNTGTSMADMYRTCELDTVVNFTAKQSISRLMETNPKAVKDSLIQSCAQILACYRKNCASPSSAGQLILPECMKLLPLYTNCLLKSDALAGGADVGCDDRAFLMSAVSSMDVLSSVAFFYPRLYPIHDVNPSEKGLPAQIRCSIEKIRDDGVYLLDNGIFLFMYIGLAVDTNWVQDVFGVGSAAQIDVDKSRLDPSRDSPVAARVRQIVDLLRQDRPRFMRLVLVRARDKLDVLFRHYLCEDRSGAGAGGEGGAGFSYVDFLCHMHKEIRALLG